VVDVDEPELRIYFTKIVNVFVKNWIRAFRTVNCQLCTAIVAGDVTERVAGSVPDGERTREWTADGTRGKGVFEGAECEFRIYLQQFEIF
jgi:3'-phosphoadenosine 5'-phosphosulfate sulfotransferase (PAPS reductase)/FAD synthetase